MRTQAARSAAALNFGESARERSIPGHAASAHSGRWLLRQLGRISDHRRSALAQAGTLHAAVAHSLATAGKLFRPRLFLGFYALSRDEEPAEAVIAAAAALETLHECSLVHDDIVDRSLVRRGRRSVPAAFGIRTSAHCGAYLAAWAIGTLARACRSMNVEVDLSPLRELVEAEIAETLGPASSAALNLARSCAIMQGKTGVLLRLPAEFGARFGAIPGEESVVSTDQLARFCESLALAYQIRDDVLDLEEDRRLRRPGNNDLTQGTPSWPITLWVSSQADTDSAWRRLRDSTRDMGRAQELRREIVQSRVLDHARDAVQRQLGQALAILSALPASLGRTVLEELLETLRLR